MASSEQLSFSVDDGTPPRNETLPPIVEPVVASAPRRSSTYNPNEVRSRAYADQNPGWRLHMEDGHALDDTVSAQRFAEVKQLTVRSEDSDEDEADTPKPDVMTRPSIGAIRRQREEESRIDS